MAKTEEELSSESLFREKLFTCDMGWAKKFVGVSRVFQSVSIYKRARTPLRELRLEKGDEEIRTTKALQTSAVLLSETREKERESSFFGWHMTTKSLSHSFNDDDFDSRAQRRPPRACRRQRRDKNKNPKKPPLDT